jgi:hypothetical protein
MIVYRVLIALTGALPASALACLALAGVFIAAADGLSTDNDIGIFIWSVAGLLGTVALWTAVFIPEKHMVQCTVKFLLTGALLAGMSAALPFLFMKGEGIYRIVPLMPMISATIAICVVWCIERDKPA